MMQKPISRKRCIIAGIVSGLIFAVLMALFDLYNQEPFSILKFVLCFSIMGFLNSYLQYKAHKNSQKISENMNQ